MRLAASESIAFDLCPAPALQPTRSESGVAAALPLDALATVVCCAQKNARAGRWHEDRPPMGRRSKRRLTASSIGPLSYQPRGGPLADGLLLGCHAAIQKRPGEGACAGLGDRLSCQSALISEYQRVKRSSQALICIPNACLRSAYPLPLRVRFPTFLRIRVPLFSRNRASADDEASHRRLRCTRHNPPLHAGFV
jgi:hypothetical protein